MAQGVGPNSFGDPGFAGDAAHDASGGVTVEAFAVVADKDGSVVAFPDGEIDGPGGAGCKGDGDDLAALAPDRERAVAAFEAEGFDVGAGRLGDPQPVEREQADEGVVAGVAEAGRDEHGPDLVAVQ